MTSALLIVGCGSSSEQNIASDMTFTEPYEFNPQRYVCYKAPQKVVIDGKLDEKEWGSAPWTSYFVDIEGSRRDVEPRYKTRAKMMWDDEYLYFAAYLEEPHVWAKLTQRESVIYNDNDFEIFLDPNGDTHNYMEYEINAFATEWDLMLTNPYRDRDCKVFNCWNINGIKRAVWVDGTINNGNDVDKGWSIEIAMPIASLVEADGIKPQQGAQWRVNFSRVEWFTQWDGKEYNVVANELTGKSGSGSEDNWVWSPQGAVAMHQPETWGFMQFSEKMAGESEDEFVWNRNEDLKWALRQLYFRMREYNAKYQAYPTSLEQIRASEVKVEGLDFAPKLSAMEGDWVISAKGFDGKTLNIRLDGKCW